MSSFMSALLNEVPGTGWGEIWEVPGVRRRMASFMSEHAGPGLSWATSGDAAVASPLRGAYSPLIAVRF